MTPNEYLEKVMDFSDYPKFEYPLYPMILLAGEAEELLCSIEERRPVLSILKECGDCLWAYMAASGEMDMIAPDDEINMESWNGKAPFEMVDYKYLEKLGIKFLRSVNDSLEKLHKWMRGDLHGKTDFMYSIQSLAKSMGLWDIIWLCGASVEYVAELNVEKLVGRRLRDTLKGNGDDR